MLGLYAKYWITKWTEILRFEDFGPKCLQMCITWPRFFFIVEVNPKITFWGYTEISILLLTL